MVKKELLCWDWYEIGCTGNDIDLAYNSKSISKKYRLMRRRLFHRRMNIKNKNMLLVIGNGFDRAHGMDTTYEDILHFIWGRINTNQVAKALPLNNNDDIKLILRQPTETIRKNLMIKWGKECKYSTEREDYKNKIYQAIYKNDTILISHVTNYTLKFGNVWLTYFTKVLDNRDRMIGKGWIDFEEEIGRVISTIEDVLLNKSQSVDTYVSKFFGNLLSDTILLKEQILPILKFDFLVFSLWMEEALKVEDGKINQLQKLKLIKEQSSYIKAIISYNYTHTPDIYGLSSQINFLHGELGKHNLVLGTSETLEDELENKYIECAYFKKKYQLIRYRLGNKFKTIFSHNQNAKWDAMIYGHSLTPADKYSLSWLFTEAENGLFAGYIEIIRIYYYDDASYDQQIANLIALIGQENVLKYVSEGRIEFLSLRNS